MGFVALLAYSTLHGPRYRAEICMSFNGRTNCRTVTAKSEAAALRAGAENACADLTSGVTNTMECVASQPQSIRWLQRPDTGNRAR
ncbi:MAG: hypothetical protein JO108_30395 [Acidobacteriaceae bacterium]|nr:hypothetical protein [Acidobacteriaceae bacterium]